MGKFVCALHGQQDTTGLQCPSCPIPVVDHLTGKRVGYARYAIVGDRAGVIVDLDMPRVETTGSYIVKGDA